MIPNPQNQNQGAITEADGRGGEDHSRGARQAAGVEGPTGKTAPWDGGKTLTSSPSKPEPKLYSLGPTP